MDQGFTKSQAEQEARGMISAADDNSDGEIGFDEFAQIWQRKLLTVNQSYIHAVFTVLDEDGSGEIEIDELAKVLDMDLDKNREELMEIIKEVDSDGNGKLNFQEFQQAMMEKKSDRPNKPVGNHFDPNEL